MKQAYFLKPMTMIVLALIAIFASCSGEAGTKEEVKQDTLAADPLVSIPNDERQKQYQALRKSIAAQQAALAEKGSVSKARAYLLQTLTDSVFPHWYETAWDFNGTTEVPREGNIACGFFVSTTLQHAGLNIDRVKCGQQASSVFINALCRPGSVKWISQNDTAKLVKHLRAQKDGLYLLGLDYHTGFIQKDGDDLWMIHAAYFPHHKVVKEKVQTCAHILESNVFVVGDLLGNDELVRKWMKKEFIPIGK